MSPERDQRPPEPRKKAAALSYDPKKGGAPRVIASGRGTIAEKIIEVANQHGIPVMADAPLAEGLIRVEIGEEIPPELYQAVAQVLAFLYRLERKSLKLKGGVATDDCGNRG